jgi:hypothetical protein
VDRKPELNSLDTVELVMAFEEEFGTEIPDDLPLDGDMARLLLEGLLNSFEAPWQQADAPQSTIVVRVIAQSGKQTLFAMPDRVRFGVGRLDPQGFIVDAQVYPSLKRALFTFVRTRS